MAPDDDGYRCQIYDESWPFEGQALGDERGPPAVALLQRALSAYRRSGVVAGRVLTGNAKSYTVARVFLRAVEAAHVRLLHTRLYRPPTG